MPAIKQSDRVRMIIREKYVVPALRAGKTNLSIRARDVLMDAEATAEFPRGRTPMICSVLQSQKLLKETGLEIEKVEGPPSLQSRTVVVHYRKARSIEVEAIRDEVATPEAKPLETPSERAFRLTEKLRGLMKDEIASFGGTEAFMRWVRADEDEE